MGQSLAGDEYAFEALVSRYRSPLLNYIRSILKNDEQAYDVLQFVLLRLYISQTTLLTDVPLRGWLFQVARHRCLDELCKQRRRPSIHFSELSWEDENEGIALIESIQDPQPSPEEIVEQLDLHAVLQQAIHSLPPRFRWVVHLHCFGHLTFSEIGCTLKMPVPTAASYVIAFCDGGYTTNLPLEEVLGGKAWVVDTYEGQPLAPQHGGPARLLVPHLYFWKSAKWVRGLRLVDEDEPGFWESLGYNNHGDPWKEERYWGD